MEHVDNGASLYGYTIQDHPVCLLVKLIVSHNHSAPCLCFVVFLIFACTLLQRLHFDIIIDLGGSTDVFSVSGFEECDN